MFQYSVAQWLFIFIVCSDGALNLPMCRFGGSGW